MKFSNLFVLILVTVSLQAKAELYPKLLSVAFGSSVPQDSSGQTLSEAYGASRQTDGEHFILKFASAKTISSIKITGYSASRSGKSLIRKASGLNGATVIALPELYQFKAVKAGNPTNYNDLVMLTDSAFVEATPNQAFTQLDVQIEGFSNDDTSFLLQVTSSDNMTVDQFLLSRTGPHSDLVLGSMLDEANYKKFNAEQLARLVSVGTTVHETELVGKTFVCTSYSKLDGADIDQKTRVYFVDQKGALFSNSNLEGSNVPWGWLNEGLAAIIQNQNGCGDYVSKNIIHWTAGGNLIAEVVTHLEDYVSLCVGAGYDEAGVRAVEANSTFPSVLNPSYVVDSYEFCRRAN